MKKNNSLERMGMVLMVVGGLFGLSKKYYYFEKLNGLYEWAKIIFLIGIAIWAFGLMKKNKK